MDCNLDVNSYVFRNIEETVGDIGKIDIHTGTGMVNQKFGSENLGIISKLNEAFKEKVISYLAPTDNDLPGTIQVTLSDKIYRYYLKKYGTKPIPTGEQLDLFNQNISKIDIDTVTLSKSGVVTIGKNSYAFKDVTADFLESLGYSISDIGRILKKIC